MINIELNRVIWIDINVGYIISKNSMTLCYKREHAVKLAIIKYCNLLVNNPNTKNFNCLEVYYILDSAYPVFEFDYIKKIVKEIISSIPDILDKITTNLNINDPNISNFMFLALLNKKYNWKESCAICLADKTMGFTHDHTEIVIFRPCGHSICANPCFVKFMESKHNVINTDTEVDEFVLIDSVNGNTNYSFTCPLCTIKVTSTFIAETTNININELNIHELITRILK